MLANWALAKAAALAASHIPRVDAVTGFETSATYQFTVLVMFAAVQMTVAFLSRPLAVLLVRVNSRLEVSIMGELHPLEN